MPTCDEMNEWREKWKKECEERDKKYYEIWLKELKEQGLEPWDSSQTPEEYYDHPNTMENSTATILWIVVMIVGTIFKGNFAIWIIATIIWWKFITRHKKKK